MPDHRRTTATETAKPARQRAARDEGVPTLLVPLASVVISVWIASSSLILPLPFTVRGTDAGLWTGGLGLLLGILSAGRLRAPRSSWRSALALFVVSVVTACLPFINGYRPNGPLAAAWLNLVVSGSLMVLLSAAGLAQVTRSRGRGGRA
jgi:peptidoglycan/LPS O-acetylase OafA/YrhL